MKDTVILINPRHEEPNVMERLHQILRGRRHNGLLQGCGPSRAPDETYWLLDSTNDWFAQWQEIEPASGKRRLRLWTRYESQGFPAFVEWVTFALNR